MAATLLRLCRLRRRSIHDTLDHSLKSAEMFCLRPFTGGCRTTATEGITRRMSHDASDHDASSRHAQGASSMDGEAEREADAPSLSSSPEEASEASASHQANIEEEIRDEFTEEEIKDFKRASREAFEDVRNKLEGTEPPKYVLNVAGEGRSGWRLLWADDEDHHLWMRDLTGGRVPDNEKNALLSPSAKHLMKIMYLQGETIEEIAEHFRVRQQRVLAILALQQLDEEREAAGKPMHWDVQQAMEGGWGSQPDGSDLFEGRYDCNEVWGSGERHVRVLPKAPHYEIKRAKNGSTIHRDLEEEEEEVTAKEDKMMIEEFKERLFFNIGMTGKNLKRQSTRAHRPRRPKKGFSLVVLPKSGSEQPYVAKPDGTLRGLNADEQALQRRRSVRPRRKLA